jgi:uncharacterized membrane protein
MARAALLRPALAAGLAIWLLFGPSPARATQDAWPALHDVSGVAADDVLNLRAGPGTEHEVVGSLAPDATGIEVIAPSEDLAWGLVNAGEGTAWASLAFLERRPGQWEGAFPPLARCFGTEPFWSVAVEGDALRLSTPDDPEAADGWLAGRWGSANRRDRFAARLLWEDGAPGFATIRAERCSDGMSDRAFGLSIDMVAGRQDAGGGLLSGCCSLAP